MVPCAAILQQTSKFCASIKEKKALPSKMPSNHLFETQSVILLHADTCRANLMAYRDAIEISSMYLVALCLLSMHLSTLLPSHQSVHMRIQPAVIIMII